MVRGVAPALSRGSGSAPQPSRSSVISGYSGNLAARWGGGGGGGGKGPLVVKLMMSLIIIFIISLSLLTKKMNPEISELSTVLKLAFKKTSLTSKVNLDKI